MASPASASRPELGRWSATLACGVALLLLWAWFFALNSWLFELGYVADQNVFYGEKALLALKGLPPRLEHIGFVYPPLPFTFTLFLNDALLASAAAAAVTATAWWVCVRNMVAGGRIGRFAAALLMGYALLSPGAVYVLTQRTDLCLLMLIFVAGAYWLRRYERDQTSADLLLAGLAFGCLVFVTFEALLLPLWLLPLLVASSRRVDPPLWATSLTLLMPIVFAGLAWGYLNWLFMGDPVYFLGQGALGRVAGASASGDPLVTGSAWRSVESVGEGLLLHAPLVAPYLLALAGLRRSPARVSGALLAAGPVALLVFRVYCGVSLGEADWVFLVPFALLLGSRVFTAEPAPRWERSAVAACFALSFLASYPLLLRSDDPAERNFALALAGRPFQAPLAEERAVVARLDGSGTVLMDDTESYRLVWLDGDPGRFLLPYQYEFETAASVPDAFADWVVVKTTADRDVLLAKHPRAAHGMLEGFAPVLETPNYVVLAREPARSARHAHAHHGFPPPR